MSCSDAVRYSSRGLAVNASDHERPDVAEQIAVRGQQFIGDAGGVGLQEAVGAGIERPGRPRHVHQLQEQMVEHVREIKGRVAEVSDLEVDHPHTVVTDEHVLRRIVAVHEADVSRLHPRHQSCDRLRKLGPSLRDRTVERIDSQLVERLVVPEMLRDTLVAKGAGVPRAEGLTESRRNLWVNVSGEQPAFPCHPGARSPGDRQRAVVTVQIEDGRDAARRDRRGEDECISLTDRALALGQPEVLDTQLRQGLLYDDARRAAVRHQNNIRDPPAQLTDDRLGAARQDLPARLNMHRRSPLREALRRVHRWASSRPASPRVLRLRVVLGLRMRVF